MPLLHEKHVSDKRKNNQRKRKYSSSSSDSSSSWEFSLSETSSLSSRSRKTYSKKYKHQNVLPMPVKKFAPYNQRDVPKNPAICKLDSTSSLNDSMDLDIEISKHSTVVNKNRNRCSPKRKRSEYSSNRRYTPSRHRYSPKRGRRDYSPRRNRSTSPPRKRRSISPMKVVRDGEGMQHTQSQIDDFDSSNKTNSSMDSFRRSIPDSTTSDEQLSQNQDSYSEFAYCINMLYKNRTNSPKRIPRDARINQVKGNDKVEPKSISTKYSQNYTNYDRNYYDEYNDYENKACNDYSHTSEPPPSTIKVLPVGNVPQVVPTEKMPQVTVKKSPVNKNSRKKIKIGNKLQIVSSPIVPVKVMPQPVASSSSAATKNKKSAEVLMKLKSAERKSELKRYRLERDRRRKEMEKKQKEKEKLEQLELRQNAVEIIKRALLFDIEGDDDGEEAKAQPSILSLINRAPGRSILIPKNENKTAKRSKKSVIFADGVIPGEGTSYYGSEQSSTTSSEPCRRPREKRFTKTKRIKVTKKKIKVKVARNYDDDEEDCLSALFPTRHNQKDVPKNPKIYKSDRYFRRNLI